MREINKKPRAVLSALVLVLLLAGMGAAENRAKYIFVFIGDGTSIPQRNAAELYLASRNNPKDLELAILRAENKFPRGNGVTDFKPSIQRMLMSSFPGQGFSSTYSANSLITDSSSSGTAIATGHKTRDGVVGMDPTATERYVSMAKMARDKGMKVGIISTVSIEHATPASFYACSPHRDFYYEIALQIPESRFNFFGGGGFRQPKGAKNDQKHIFDVLKEAEYTVCDTREGFDKIKAGDDKILAINPVLDDDAALPYAIDRSEGDITFAEFVAKGIEVLDNPGGFFMMAECGKVDWACHANDAVATVNDVLTLDDAVEVAYEFYKKHPDETLIVVTGDHETGGMTVGFAGTHYDAFLKKLGTQKGSYIAFNTEFAAFKKTNPNAELEDALPLVESFFGLKRYGKEETEKLSERAKAGDAEAYETLGMALKDYEMADLEEAFAMSVKDRAERPADDDVYYISYGTYEPFTVTLTHILNHKAGIGWTTYAHTGLPTPVSAVGVGQEQFNGYYDNTDIFRKVVAAGHLEKSN
ncbi:MAG: alkaline phosphatase [Synergistaceae bacterium]|jgi:alkaline phosphatase|nr:alkaline phosphatase [Synergistaceae bacterium]